jgi:type I restriction enzyme S subunit
MPPTFPDAPLKRVCEIRLGKMLQPSPVSADDVQVRYLKAGHLAALPISASELPEMWASKADLAQYSVEAGDVVIIEGGDVGRTAFVPVVDYPTIIQNSLHRLRAPYDRLRFTRYALESLYYSGVLAEACNRSTIMHLTTEKLGVIRVPHPPRRSCADISDFLDRETARIDALVTAKLRLKNLVIERRQTLGSMLVFGRGFAHRAQTRADRLPTIGAVPAHWNVMRNKFLMREVTDLSVDGHEELLTVSHLTGVTARAGKDVNMFMAESTVGYKRCLPGDLVINTMWAWMGAFGVTSLAGIVSPAYGVYRMDSTIALPEYYDFFFRTPAYIAEMTRYSKGVWTSRLRLYPDSFLSLDVVVPPLDEQRTIVAELRRQTTPLDALLGSLDRQLTLLAAHREALITAAVTGQIDVTREAPSPPEEALEPA